MRLRFRNLKLCVNKKTDNKHSLGGKHKLVGLGLRALWLLLALGPPASLAQNVTATVVDQQQHRIVGAQVDWICGSDVTSSYTNVAGQVSFSRTTNRESCLLQVRHPGFRGVRKTIGCDINRFSVTLSLPIVQQVVKVSGRESNTDPTEGQPVGGVLLSRTQLKTISNNSEDLVKYAKLMAGAAPGPDNIYVDGLPARTLPPTELISQISVNANPFSVEYADSEKNHIEILTASPDRRWHFDFGGAGLQLGGNSPLAQGLRSSSIWAVPSVSGAIPDLPLTFSMQGSFGSISSDQLVQAVIAGAPPGAKSAVQSGNSTDSGSLNLHYSSGAAERANLFYNQLNMEAWNSGVGGITLPVAATSNSFDSREVRGTVETDGARWLMRGGLAVSWVRANTLANTTSPNVEVPGYFASGGSPASDTQTAESSWTLKTVFQANSQSRYWAWGASFLRTSYDEHEAPNPNGKFTFATLSDYIAALSGAPTGTWLVARGVGRTRHTSIKAAPFLEAEIWHSKNSMLTGGLRADYQPHGRIALSPRISEILAFHGFIFRSGAGLFVQNLPDSMFVEGGLNDGVHFREFLSSDVSLLNPSGTGIPGTPVIAQISPHLERPTDLISRASVQRTLGNFSLGAEYSWTVGMNLLGSRRLRLPGEWLDIVESTRNLRRHEIQERAQYHWGKQSIFANYRWIHSRDNTDGSFSFPEFQEDIHSEWARSTAIPAHNASLVTTFSLPMRVSIAVLGNWHSSSPFTILTGQDLRGDGLFNDRGGRPRNSGNGPGYQSVDLNVHRTLNLARLWHSKSNTSADCGFQVNNLLNGKNYVALGSVIGSPLFERPLSAQPGRSLRLSFNLAR